jgi:hypothetical protein
MGIEGVELSKTDKIQKSYITIHVVMYSKQIIMKKGGRTELEKSTWRIKIRYISLKLYYVNTKIFVIFIL